MQHPNLAMDCHREKNMPLAAFLLVSKIPLLHVETDPNTRRVTWLFANNLGECERAALDFANGAAVPARDYASALQQLKRTLPNGGAR